MDANIIKRSCLKEIFEQNLVNDPNYESFFKLFELSNEEVLVCVEPQVKFLTDSLSSNEVDPIAVRRSVSVVSGFARVGSFFYLFL